jgi:hypothetical protein
MKNAINTALADRLRNFALSHNEIEFAHFVSAALAGEQWAVERFVAIEPPVPNAENYDWYAARVLRVIRSIDPTRPDGAIARGIEI